MHHLLPIGQSQVSGHIVSCSRHVAASIESSLLQVAIEVGTLRRWLMYCCKIAEATPEEEDLASSPQHHKLQPPEAGIHYAPLPARVFAIGCTWRQGLEGP